MFKIPLESYRSPAGPHAVIELDDEGGRIRLVLELEPRELVGTFQQVEEHVDAADLALPDSDDPKELRIVELEGRLETTKLRLSAVTAHRDYLKGRLERLADERDVSRELLPHEAREVAAALWHYASEADAFGRRP